MSQPANFVEPNAYQTLREASTEIRQHSYAAPNRFEVMITPPAGQLAGTARRISLRCETINLPGRNLTTSPDNLTYGPTREVVDGITYAEDITMTFNASSGMDERVFFEKWQELAFDRKTWNMRYYEEYTKGAVEIYLLDRQDKKRYGIKLIEAFPKTIGPTDLSQAANNEIIKTTVSFAFRYWETLDIERQPISNRGDTKVEAAVLNPATQLTMAQAAALPRPDLRPVSALKYYIQPWMSPFSR